MFRYIFLKLCPRAIQIEVVVVQIKGKLGCFKSKEQNIPTDLNNRDCVTGSPEVGVTCQPPSTSIISLWTWIISLSLSILPSLVSTLSSDWFPCGHKNADSGNQGSMISCPLDGKERKTSPQPWNVSPFQFFGPTLGTCSPTDRVVSCALPGLV